MKGLKEDLVLAKLGLPLNGFYKIKDNELTLAQDLFNNEEYVGWSPLYDVIRDTNYDGITKIDKKLKHVLDMEFDKKSKQLGELFNNKADYTYIEKADTIINSPNLTNMNADEVFHIYRLLDFNPSEVSIATFTASYDYYRNDLKNSYVIISVRQKDGSIKYYFKEDYKPIEEVAEKVWWKI